MLAKGIGRCRWGGAHTNGRVMENKMMEVVIVWGKLRELAGEKLSHLKVPQHQGKSKSVNSLLLKAEE